MNWFIDDYSRTEILITNGAQEFYVPKFRIELEISGDYVTIFWNDRERGTGGDQRSLTMNYLDVVDGYSGYIDNPTSAVNLAAQIDAMIDSAWTDIATGGGDLLTAKGDLLSHDGVSDTILPVGTNEYILSVDNSTQTGLKWIPNVSDPNVLSFHIGTYTFGPVDGTTVVFSGGAYIPVGFAAGVNSRQYSFGRAVTIIGANIQFHSIAGVVSNENISLYLYTSGSTDNLVATAAFGTSTGNAQRCRFTNFSMNIPLTNVTTDTLLVKVVFPTWATNPGNAEFSGEIFYTVD